MTRVLLAEDDARVLLGGQLVSNRRRCAVNKMSKADVAFRRQETQYSCCAASIAAALKAHGKDVTESGLNKVLGASPMGGATWEAMLATVQYFGLRGTLVVPSTIAQLKAWTDAGIPVIIAWNPEGRPWSHASCVFDVDDDHTVHIMDPNIPDPNETVRVVPKAEFYSKWGEAIGDNLIVRRPAMAIEREVTADGRQVQAGKKELRSMKDRDMSRYLKNGPVRPTDKSDATHAMDKAQWEIRKDMGMAGLPGAGMGAGPHKDKSQYDRKREKNFDREAAATQPLMTRRDYGVTAMLNTTNFQRILKMAEDLPGPVEDYVKEVQEANPDYSESQAWATAWSIYCVAGTTQVFTSMGLVTVGEIAKRAIMSKVGHGGVTAGEIQTILTTHRGQGVSSHVVNTGVKPVVTLTTKHGYTLTCTPDHRILALNTGTYAVEWVPAGECEGRYLVLPTHGTWGTQVNLSGDTFTKNVHNNVIPLRRPMTMTRDLARVLGYLVAEGSVTEEGVEFSNSDPKVVDDYVRCMMSLFGEAPKVIWTQPSESNRYTKPAAKARSRTRWYMDFFSNLGLAPCVATEKVVPTTILNAPKKFVVEFLRAFTEGDGFVGDAQHPNRVDLGTASKTLAGQLHLILSNLGILATLEVNQKGYYTVRVNSAPMARKFRDVVGGGVFKTPTITDTNGRGSEFECIPAEGIQSLHKKIANKIPGTERVSLSRIKALWGVLESYGDRATLNNLRDLVDNGYMFDPVESVCDAGEAEVFDLSVPGDESFVANGLIAHNCKYKNPGSEHCQKSPSEYFKAAALKIAGMSKRAGYTHYWEIKAAPTPAEWTALMAATKKILAAAKRVKIVVRGGLGTGVPEVKADGIWLNGDSKTGDDHETFSLEPVVSKFEFCKTAEKPYDAVVVSILAAAKEILGDKIEVRSDGGPSAIRRVLGGDITAKFEKGVSMTVDEVAEVVGPEFKEMNESPPPSVLKVRDEMQGKTAAVSEGVQRALIRLYEADAATFGDPPTNHKSYGAKSSGFTPRVTVPMYREGLVESDFFSNGAPINVKLTEKGATLARTLLNKMLNKTSAAKRATHLENPKKPGFNLCGEKSYPETMADGPRDATCHFCKQAWQKAHGGHMASTHMSVDMFADLLKDSKFEKGKSVPLTELPEELQDNVTDPPPSVKKLTEELKGKQAGGALAMDMFAEALKEGKFEEGEPADPTENMSPEDAAEWERQNEEHKDNFKGAGTAARTAATGLYGFNKSTESACGAGVNKLQKAAKRIASALYAKDEGSPSFLDKHAVKGGSKTASMLLKAMESIGPMAQINKTAGRSGTGLYGFSEKTAKLGLAACNDLHHEAGVIAGDLFARKGADPVKVAGYLASHAKKAKCPYAALIGECAPDAPSASKEAAKKPAKPDTDFVVEEDDGIWSVVGKPSKFVYSTHGSETKAEKAKGEWLDAIPARKPKKATDFLASDEDDDADEEVRDIVSKC